MHSARTDFYPSISQFVRQPQNPTQSPGRIRPLPHTHLQVYHDQMEMIDSLREKLTSVASKGRKKPAAAVYLIAPSTP